MASVKNPSFPHWCRLYRIEGAGISSEGEEKVFYEGKCLKYGSSNLRTFRTGNVIRGDYAVDIPVLVTGCGSGDFIDVEDYTGKFSRIILSDVQPGEMGTTVYFNMSHN